MKVLQQVMLRIFAVSCFFDLMGKRQQPWRNMLGQQPRI